MEMRRASATHLLQTFESGSGERPQCAHCRQLLTSPRLLGIEIIQVCFTILVAAQTSEAPSGLQTL